MIARHTLTLRRHVPGPPDRNGRPTSTWAPDEPIRVFSLGYPTTAEKGGELVTDRLMVGMPSHYGIGSRDRVLVRGEAWQVVGHVLDSGMGPFGYAPGYVMTLERVSGA